MRTDLQNYFNQYHEKIKLIDTEDNEVLRTKRDLLVKEITDYLKKKSEEENKSRITFVVKNQGSYSMGTGIKPLDGDYDIDVMLLFNISKDDYKPVEVKQWVFDALNKKLYRTVEIKRPCVRVQYKKNGEDTYHVDFAVYSERESNDDKHTYLAKGYPGSADDKKIWERSNPKELKEIINNKFTDTDEKAQFKRVIRYLKRWKDEKFSSNGNCAPTGIAITALALELFKPKVKDIFTSEKEINDFEALTELVKAILNRFFLHRISVQLPVLPYNNLFEKMSDQQMKDMENKLKTLKSKLEEAENEVDPVDACEILQKALGNIFPVPDAKETGQKRQKAFSSSTESA